jgi:SAM-dependent methyltransferase
MTGPLLATPDVAKHYDTAYETQDFFRQDNRWYRAFIVAIAAQSRISVGAKVLDAGCGQGYLSRHLAACGMDVWCADISAVALKSLDRHDSLFKGKRILADLRCPPFHSAFDMVFLRSCSLLNETNESVRTEVIHHLTDCVKPGGVICVAYNSNLSGRGSHWLNHTRDTFRRSFNTSRLTNVQIYVVNKLDCLVLGRYSFNRAFTFVNTLLSRLTGKCCELVILARRST